MGRCLYNEFPCWVSHHWEIKLTPTNLTFSYVVKPHLNPVGYAKMLLGSGRALLREKSPKFLVLLGFSIANQVQESLIKPSQICFKAAGPLIFITILRCTDNLQPGGLTTWRTFVKQHFMWFLFYLHIYIHTHTQTCKKMLVRNDSHYYQVLVQSFT